MAACWRAAGDLVLLAPLDDQTAHPVVWKEHGVRELLARLGARLPPLEPALDGPPLVGVAVKAITGSSISSCVIGQTKASGGSGGGAGAATAGAAAAAVVA
eukprot:CAMPEP_0119353364 /NCGR_PEP_ID=MMETSP1334-20130426/2527_1 /TAXON_ID=127549 /ORGANISM="Calcidiscus leptoporus, Strain RCC1130" /LENGTH=100 /DNA_ID=CAMNT_0007366629 /DNA_START=142 /DNA_END=442 /DNA_ORIENTATION=-